MKRACPALGKQICAVCCGTKRIVEISCPADCAYLTTARSHPPAVVQRRQEADRSMLLPLIAGFSERQARIFLMFSAVVARHQPELLHRLRDEDIAEAAAAQAATLETAGRGIVYDHRAPTIPAERLLTEFKTLTAEITKEAGPALERDIALALRRMEEAARAYAKGAASGDALQQLLVRTLLPQGPQSDASGAAVAPASSLIV